MNADARVGMDRRLECPECHCADIIFNQKTLIKSMEYRCPQCKTRFVAEPPKTPPTQPSLPPGSVYQSEERKVA